jgi:hypothetical protein
MGSFTQIVELTHDVKKFYQSLSITTQKCLKNNHDLKNLFYKFGESFDTVNKTFTLYAQNNYINLKFFFSNISKVLNSKNYI